MGARAAATTTTKATEARSIEEKKMCESGVYTPHIPYGTVPYRTAFFVFFLCLHVNYLFFNSFRNIKPGLV